MEKSAKKTLYVGTLVICGVMALYFLQPSFIQRLDHKIYDMLLPMRHWSTRLPPPVLIEIDEDSLEKHGPWPWPRYLAAEAIDKVAKLGVKAIGLDIALSEPDFSSPRRMRELLKRDKSVDIAFTGLPEELFDFDDFMAASLRKAPVVIGVRTHTTQRLSQQRLPPAGIVLEKKGTWRTKEPAEYMLPHAQSLSAPLPLFLREASLGLTDITQEPDGLVRRHHLLWLVGQEVYPALPLRLLMRSLNTDTLEMHLDSKGLYMVQIGNLRLPVKPDGSMLIPFHGDRNAYLRVSAGAILRAEVPRELLQGRTAFIGFSTHDIVKPWSTPHLKSASSLEIYAATLDAIAHGVSIEIPAWADRLQVTGILLLGVVSALAFSLGRAPVHLSLAGLGIGGSIFGSAMLFSRGLFLSPLYALLTIVASGLLILPLRALGEQRQRRMLRAAFSRYVSPEIVQRVTNDRDTLLSGEERELSILFTDIRGFSSLSEKLTPPQLASLLNRCFAPMTAIVREHDGTLDKFIGDALMAFWNAPLTIPRHPVRAVTAALAMHDSLALLNREFVAHFGFSVAMGTGINTGSVYVGNMGSTEFINYTLIGDDVNLASRIESLCAVYDVPIVASEETMLDCGGSFGVQYLDTLRVKGRETPVSIFLPMSWDTYAERKEEIVAWMETRALYKKGDFKKAAEAFAVLCSIYPGVRLYAVYLERIRLLLTRPPARWDGIWNMDEKSLYRRWGI